MSAEQHGQSFFACILRSLEKMHSFKAWSFLFFSCKPLAWILEVNHGQPFHRAGLQGFPSQTLPTCPGTDPLSCHCRLRGFAFHYLLCVLRVTQYGTSYPDILLLSVDGQSTSNTKYFRNEDQKIRSFSDPKGLFSYVFSMFKKV